MARRWDQKFLESTRGRIVVMLHQRDYTVDELAHELKLTDNAVRMHLANLERDGLVQQRGLKRGGGKPAFSYSVTPEAARLFPKAYGPVLRQLLDVLAEQMGPDALEVLLRTVGQRIAATRHAPTANGRTLRARLDVAGGVLNDLGGLAEVEEQDGELLIRGYSCPLVAVVPGHPEVCSLAETMLTELIGVPVRECCERGEPLRCCFEVLNGSSLK
jgi:predicted ArsR family transcriptional regulator